MKNFLHNLFQGKDHFTYLEKIILLTILFMLGVLYAEAQLVGYPYKDAIKVHENSGTQKVNYQVLITVNTQTLITAGKMQSTGNDIRFSKNCNGSTLYNYYIESGINTTTTKIWVQIDTLAANGDRLFYMMYGNATASAASNFNTCFPLSLVVSAGTVTQSGANNYDWFEIQTGATVVITPNSPFSVNARMIRIAGTLDGNAAGYLGGTPGANGSGPGAGKVSTGNLGTFGAGGAGYGGVGGNGGGAGAATPATVGLPGGTYGTIITDTIEMGSGGGGAASGGQGGNGGASITLNGDYVEISGNVYANGGDGLESLLNGAGGAGSGGGIRIKGYMVNLSGMLTAIGGDGVPGGYGSGGGGGGRIKIFSDASLINTAGMYVDGGAAGAANGETVPQTGGTVGTTATGTYLAKIPSYTNPAHVILTASANPICAGDNVIFTASTGFGNYNFYRGLMSVQSTASNSYSSSSLVDNDSMKVLASDMNGCLDTSNVILMDVNTVATPTITQAGSTLSSSSGTGNQWYFNGTLIPGATGQDHVATADGNYTVEVTIGACSALSSPYIYTTTGISVATTNTDILLYPNPNTGTFILTGVSLTETTFLSIYNALGIVVAVIELQASGSGTQEVKFNDLTNGVYFIVLYDKNARVISQERMIIQK